MTLGIVGGIPSAFELSAAQAYDPLPLAEGFFSSNNVASLLCRPGGERSSAPDVDVDVDEGEGGISTADIVPQTRAIVF